jgi:hypothetical protein
MDIFRLDDSSYLPTEVVDLYDSAIWTERFLEAGEFEIVSNKVDATAEQLPIGSLISHSGTNEVMIVDTHSVELNDLGQPTLTVSGLSFETILASRHLLAGHNVNSGEPWYVKEKFTPAQIASMIIWEHLSDDYEYSWDPLAIVENSMEITYLRDPDDAIDNLRVSLTTIIADKQERWEIEPGNLYEIVLEILEGGEQFGDELGIRSIRPHGASAKVVKYGNDGFSRVDVEDVKALLIDIYNGKDRSLGQTERPQIVFDESEGHVSSFSYLKSTRGRANIVHVDHPYANIGNWHEVRKKNTPAGVHYITGRKIRVRETDDADIRTREGRRYLRKQTPEKIIECEISTNNPWRYGTDYGLGDTVSVVGDEQVTGTMTVQEFVWTDDKASGETKYPTLVQI